MSYYGQQKEYNVHLPNNGTTSSDSLKVLVYKHAALNPLMQGITLDPKRLGFRSHTFCP